jgi:murein DD-endopeptidase MepM/ murein hydrolase activator NlpD
MGHFTARACVFAVVVAALPPVEIAGQQVASGSGVWLSVSVSTGPLYPGGVARLAVTSPTALTSLEGQAFGQAVRFWQSTTPTEWRGLVGVGLATSAGTYNVTILATRSDGEKGTSKVALRVQPKRFETRRLQVDPALVNPPADQTARIERESKAVAEALAGSAAERLWRGPFRAPVPGVATSSFGRLTVMNGESRGRHQGADFRAQSGTPVLAPNAGRVVLAQDLYFSGNTVIVDHGLGVLSYVAHLSRLGVAVGARVSRGDLLGESGATGRVTGPHLHWAVRLGGASVDPLALMKALAEEPDTVP